MTERITDPHKAIDYMLTNAADYAEAKAKRIYLEEFRKSKKAILMREIKEGTIADKESYAYSHPDYIELVKGIQVAVQKEEKLRWELVAAQARIDVWRSEESTKRAEMSLV